MTHLLLDSKVMRISRALERARIPYAFGGAIALAYYAAPRGTEDIDVNVFLTAEEAGTCWEDLERLGIEIPFGGPRPARPPGGPVLGAHANSCVLVV